MDRQELQECDYIGEKLWHLRKLLNCQKLLLRKHVVFYTTLYKSKIGSS